MTEPLPPHVEDAVSGVFRPLLWAPATWVYLCHANVLAGVECHAFGDDRSLIEFPAEVRP